MIGNIKGLQDPYRNPTTQKGFAEKWGQNPAMVTSFADGSKISFEQAIVANATGFVVKSRGMSRGLEYKDDVMKIGKIYDIEERRKLGGIIDYVVGTPLTKVYVPGGTSRPQATALSESLQDGRRAVVFLLHSLSPGPLRSAVGHCSRGFVPRFPRQASGWPSGRSLRGAKRDLKAGEMLDDYGMYMTYGEAVNTDEMCRMTYLPEGLVEGCVLKHDIPKDAVITYDDVTLPPGRLADQLRAEQYRMFSGETWLEELELVHV